MAAILYISIFICFFGFAFSRKKVETTGLLRKFQTYPIGVIIGIFCCRNIIILMSANRTGFDAFNFKIIFDYVVRNGKNPWDYTYEAFAYVIRLFSKFFEDASYYEFHAFMVSCLLVLLIFFYEKYAYSFFSVCFLYLISGIYATDGIQFKNFISTCLLACGLTFLVKDGKKDLVKYFIFVLVAAILHFSFVFYFFLPLIRTQRFRKVKTIIPIFGIMVYIFFILGGQRITSGFIMLLARLPMLEKLANYEVAISGRRSLVPAVIYILVLLILYFCKSGANQLPEEKRRFTVNIWNIWLMMGIALPFLVYANAVYRIFRNLYIPIFVVMANYLTSMPRLSKKRVFYSTVIVCVVLILYIHPILLGQAVDVYVPVMEGEYFWIR